MLKLNKNKYKLSNINYKYVYPRLPCRWDLKFLRIGGSGIGNCLFVFSKALIYAKKHQIRLINPAWINISIGPYLRREVDKRHYLSIYYKNGVSGIIKAYIFLQNLINCLYNKSVIYIIEDIEDYFQPLIAEHKYISSEIYSISQNIFYPEKIAESIAVHVRLGDYKKSNRSINNNWFIGVINEINRITNFKYKFILFSDGKDNELEDIMMIKNVNRLKGNNKNCFEEILLMSKCKFIIGSDSTFSGWAAYLGQKPFIYNKKHFGRLLINQENEIHIEDNIIFPENFIKICH